MAIVLVEQHASSLSPSPKPRWCSIAAAVHMDPAPSSSPTRPRSAAWWPSVTGQTPFPHPRSFCSSPALGHCEAQGRRSPPLKECGARLDWSASKSPSTRSDPRFVRRVRDESRRQGARAAELRPPDFRRHRAAAWHPSAAISCPAEKRAHHKVRFEFVLCPAPAS